MIPQGKFGTDRRTLASSELDGREAAELWDAIVIGAGPAGAMTAMRLAKAGHRVLLVEAKSFPRDKVCGGCLNPRAWSVLNSSGLGPKLEQAGAIELNRLHLSCGRRAVEWPMPTMRALSRRALDEIVVSAAVAEGVRLSTETHARVEPSEPASDWISVQLKHRDGQQAVARAKIVIAADGLAHSSLGAIEQSASRVARGSRVGLGATVAHDGTGYPSGRLTMVVGRAGYVGVTRVEQGRLNLAAAISTSSLRPASRSGNLLQAGDAVRPGDIIAGLLSGAGLEVPPGTREAAWVGTPPLTRQSLRWSARRLFLVGDATGYVEPFTGEGMSWALAGAVEVSRFAERGIMRWTDDLAEQWHDAWRENVRRHQAALRGLAWLLRRPRLAEIALAGARYAPWLANWTMQRVAGPPSSINSLGYKV